MATKTSRKAAFKEEIKHVLEELWDSEEEEPFYKIFTRVFMNAKGTQKIIRDSKTQLKDL